MNADEGRFYSKGFPAFSPVTFFSLNTTYSIIETVNLPFFARLAKEDRYIKRSVLMCWKVTSNYLLCHPYLQKILVRATINRKARTSSHSFKRFAESFISPILFNVIRFKELLKADHIGR
jgi:hypothetical protein